MSQLCFICWPGNSSEGDSKEIVLVPCTAYTSHWPQSIIPRDIPRSAKCSDETIAGIFPVHGVVLGQHQPSLFSQTAMLNWTVNFPGYILKWEDAHLMKTSQIFKKLQESLLFWQVVTKGQFMILNNTKWCQILYFYFKRSFINS